MELLKYLKQAAIDCGAHPLAGRTAGLVLKDEKENNSYPKGAFKNAKERARMLLPFKPKWYKLPVYWRKLKVLELTILKHYNKDHKDKTVVKRMKKLAKGLSNKEIKISWEWWW